MNRRQFVLSGLAALATLATPSKLGSQEKSKAELLFGRPPLDVKRLPSFSFEADNDLYIPTPEEIALYSEFVPRQIKVMGKQVLQTTFDKARTWHSIIIEPDDEYAKRYEQQTKISIQHAKKFFDFPELNTVSLEFNVPKSAKDAVLCKDPLKIHLVAELGERKSLGFYTAVEGGTEPMMIPVTSKRVLLGKYFTDASMRVDKGKIFMSPIGKRGIFCSTTGSLESLISDPIHELLHCSLKDVFYQHLNKQFQRANNSPASYFINVFKKLDKREEKFVHALSVLWLEQYNKDRDLGFTRQELEEYFTKQESADAIYSGMQTLAKHIKKIGLQEARRLYIRDQDKLFSVIEK